MKRNKSIGIFDSGFGGLHVTKAIDKILSQYNLIYLGDSARIPYGTRSMDLVYKFTRQAVDFLFSKNCELIIIACNTVSAEALRKIQREYIPRKHPGKKVLGVIIPAAEHASKTTKNKKVGVMATNGTVKSGAFIRELKKINPKIKVFQAKCPLLVPIIENGEHNSQMSDIAIEKYIHPLIKEKIDTLILGCTHYGILEKKIKKIAGSGIKIICESEVVAHKLKDYLKRHSEIEKYLGKNKKREFYTTDLTDNFQKLGSKIFGKKIKVKKAIL